MISHSHKLNISFFPLHRFLLLPAFSISRNMSPSTVTVNRIEEVEEEEEEDSFTKPLGRRSVIYYGTGHMLNDITAACWFTYLLLFLTDIGLSPRDAASVMLSGQIADAFATIFTGELVV